MTSPRIRRDRRRRAVAAFCIGGLLATGAACAQVPPPGAAQTTATQPDTDQPSLLGGESRPGSDGVATPSQPPEENSTPDPPPTESAAADDPSTTPAKDTPPDKVDCAKAKCLALTFDDGPVPGTAAMLDLLAEKGVRATFFVIGTHAAEHPEILRRMVAEGHVVGNHTYDHPNLAKLSAASVRRQLTRANTLIARATGVTPKLMRPPFGSANATVRQVSRDLKLTPVLWSVDPLDWSDRDAGVVARRVVARATAGGIILSHDIYPSTRKAYARIIDRLRAKGFVLVTVPELVGGRFKPGVTLSQR